MKKLALPILLIASTTQAAPFNAMDTRAMAMGDTGVATSAPGSAALFNPALLSNYHNDHTVSIIVPNIAIGLIADQDAVDAVENIEDEEYFDRMTTAVDAFNLSNSAADAQEISDISAALNTEFSNINNQPININGNGTFSVAVPNPTIGIGVYANSFTTIEATPLIDTCDLELLSIYAQTATDVANSNTPTLDVTTSAACGSELVYDAGLSDFIDPTDNLSGATNLDSDIFVAGIQMNEVGIALSREFNILGKDISFGITPKMLEVTSFFALPSMEDLDDDNYDLGDELEASEETESDVNLDFGIATNFLGDSLTVGATIKNLISRSYETAQDSNGNSTTFDIDPQVRAGVAWDLPIGLTVAADMDITKNKPFFNGEETQYLGAGVEWNLINTFKFRAGARSNLANSDDTALTAGIGFNLAVVHIDLATQFSSNNAAAALQFGVEF